MNGQWSTDIWEVRFRPGLMTIRGCIRNQDEAATCIGVLEALIPFLPDAPATPPAVDTAPMEADDE